MALLLATDVPYTQTHTGASRVGVQVIMRCHLMQILTPIPPLRIYLTSAQNISISLHIVERIQKCFIVFRNCSYLLSLIWPYCVYENKYERTDDVFYRNLCSRHHPIYTGSKKDILKIKRRRANSSTSNVQQY